MVDTPGLCPQPGCTCIPCHDWNALAKHGFQPDEPALCAVYQHEQVQKLQAKYPMATVTWDGGKDDSTVVVHHTAGPAPKQNPPKSSAELASWNPDETLTQAAWDGQHWTVIEPGGIEIEGPQLDQLFSVATPGLYYLLPGKVIEALKKMDEAGPNADNVGFLQHLYSDMAGPVSPPIVASSNTTMKPTSLYEALAVGVDVPPKESSLVKCMCGCGAGYDEHDHICPPHAHGPEEHGLEQEQKITASGGVMPTQQWLEIEGISDISFAPALPAVSTTKGGLKFSYLPDLPEEAYLDGAQPLTAMTKLSDLPESEQTIVLENVDPELLEIVGLIEPPELFRD